MKDVVRIKRGAFSLFMITLSFLPLFLKAQNRQSYDSLYQPMLGYSGKAKFEYYTDRKGNRIKQGDFEFESMTIDSVCFCTADHRVWEGQYKNDLKHGDWVYDDRFSRLILRSVDDDFNAVSELHSERERVSASFKEGTAEGNWTLQTIGLVNGKKAHETHWLQTKLKKAKMEGAVEFRAIRADSTKVRIKGQADAGLMIGTWTLEYEADSMKIWEQRQYELGFLLSLIKRNEQGDTLVALEYPLSKNIRNFLNNDEWVLEAANFPLSLTYSDGYPRTSEYIVQQSKGNDLLNDQLKLLFKYEPDFFSLNGLPLGTNRMAYPLSAEEEKLLQDWPNVEFEFRDKIDDLRTMQATNFKFANNDTLRFIEQWIERQFFLRDYIKPWNNIFASNELQYYYRQGQLFTYAQDLLAVDTLMVQEEPIRVEYPVQIADSSFMHYVVDNFRMRSAMADSLAGVYRLLMESLNMEQSIRSLDARITRQKQELDSIYAPGRSESLRAQLRSSIRKKFLNSHFDARYQAFLKHSGPAEDQKATGDSILFDLQRLNDINTEILEIFDRRSMIDSLYTEYVFDPYTFNDRFPKRLKRKLYNMAAEELFTDLVEEAISARNISELSARLMDIKGLQERLVFLLDKDTRKIEKKIKPKMSIADRLDLLKIE